MLRRILDTMLSLLTVIGIDLDSCRRVITSHSLNAYRDIVMPDVIWAALAANLPVSAHIMLSVVSRVLVSHLSNYITNLFKGNYIPLYY